MTDVDNGPRTGHDPEHCPECQLLDAGYAYDAPPRPERGDDT